MTLPVDTTPRLGRFVGFPWVCGFRGAPHQRADQRLSMKIRMVRGFGKIEALYRLSTYFNQCIEKIFGRHSEDALVAMDLHQNRLTGPLNGSFMEDSQPLGELVSHDFSEPKASW